MPSALDEYRRHKRIAEEILSELHQTNLKTASVSRELADAAIAEQAAEIAKMNDAYYKAEEARYDAVKLCGEQAAEIKRLKRHQCDCADNGFCRKVNTWTNQIGEQAEQIQNLKWMLDDLSHCHWPYKEKGNEAHEMRKERGGAVMNKGTSLPAFAQASLRIEQTPELQPFRDVILYDWEKGRAHYLWAAECDLDELLSWARTIQGQVDGGGTDATRGAKRS
jgi:hypothetical protein